MDHNIFLNQHSMPADNKAEAYSMLQEACLGILELRTGDEDRFFLYYDDIQNNSLKDCVLAQGYTYNDFLSELEQNEQDLALSLMEMDDKSPALNFLETEQKEIFDKFFLYEYYLPNTAYNENMYILGIAWLLQASLLSLPTATIWDASRVIIACSQDESLHEQYSLHNIARYEHGVEWRKEWEQLSEKTLEELLQNCRITERFTTWYNELSSENSYRVRSKLQLANEKNFQGGEPLFKNLKDTDGMREIRFSAYPGGAIRVLIGGLPDQQQAILVGFIKKSDDEGYTENIKRAAEEWKTLLAN
ncbi:MAG: hypothetical protein GY754_46535 [bacterium]|nr:hypothetical protein [bacterium]